MTARDQMLGTIRAALADVPAGEALAWNPAEDRDPAAAYQRSGEIDRERLTDLFAGRCGAYRATVTRCPDTADAIATAARNAFERHPANWLVPAPGLPVEWIPSGVPTRPDQPPLSVAELDGGVAALTACAGAIALTGTLILDGGTGQGRRALTLIPDVHICVVRAEQIVYAVPEAIRALAASAGGSQRAITLISGPSATSDIELERVEGVHGPRQLEVVLAG